MANYDYKEQLKKWLGYWYFSESKLDILNQQIDKEEEEKDIN